MNVVTARLPIIFALLILASATVSVQSTFTNYAWFDQPFTGENAFLGDYEWLTAYGGRVYGIWAEAAPEDYQLVPRPSTSSTPSGRPRTPTIVRVRTADFGAKR
jgi:hypothetical protein